MHRALHGALHGASHGALQRTYRVILPLVLGQLVRPSLAGVLKGRKKLLSRSSETLLLAIVYTTFCDTFLRGFGMPASTVALLGAPRRTARAPHAHR